MMLLLFITLIFFLLPTLSIRYLSPVKLSLLMIIVILLQILDKYRLSVKAEFPPPTMITSLSL